MFLEYYGLTEQPFGVTPDPRFLFLGSKHREALASLIYGTESNRGFVALIAKPGMGKTSLLFQYLEGLRNKARTAFIFQTDCDRRELLRHILNDLGLNATGKDLPEMHEMFNRVLLEEKRAGRRFVLVIDEAQNLEEKALETIRLLSNFETPGMKLMQILIAGQSQLAERLAQPSLAQIRQRISMIVRIEPFTREETAEYIRHRLCVAGYKGPSPFTVAARLMIAEHSQGIPRNINNICFNAMSLACALKRKVIDRDTLDEVLADLDLQSLKETVPAVEEIKGKANHPVSELSLRSKPKSTFRNWAPRLGAAALFFFAISRPVKDLNYSGIDDAFGGAPSAIPFVNRASVHGSSESTELANASHASIQTDGENTREPAPEVNEVHKSPDIPATAASGTRSVTVLPGQTLYRLAIENLGNYDDEVFREICQLNPWLMDPADIKTGQVIIFPSIRRNSASPLPVVSQAFDSKVPSLEKR